MKSRVDFRMKHLRGSFVNCMLIFFAGSIVLGLLTLDLQARFPGRVPQEKSSSTDSNEEKKTLFHLTKRAHGRTEDGAFVSGAIYAAPGHESVSAETVHYDSEAQVEEAFELWMKRAVKVSEREVINRLPIRPNAQRALIISTSAEGKPTNIVITTAGSRLLLICSYSLQDALAFERQFRPD